MPGKKRSSKTADAPAPTTRLTRSSSGAKKAKTEPKETKKESKKESKKQQQGFSISKLLEGVVVNDVTGFMKDGTLIKVKKGETLWTALLTLIENKILSAAVEDESGKYIGFVDTVDIMTAVIDVAEKNGTFKKKVDPDDELINETFELDELNVGAIADLSERDEFISVKTTDPLMNVLNILSEKDKHRVAVLGDDNENNANPKFVGLISQSGLCEYLIEEHAEAFNKQKTKIGDLHLPHNVWHVNVNVKAYEAFKTMRDKKVSGLAVFDDANTLVDVVSASDLMLWSEWTANEEKFRFRDLAALGLPLKEFLQNSRTQRGVEHKKPLTANKTTLLSDAISTMLENNVHRLFLVDESGKADGVVTYGDILRYLKELK